MLKLVFAFFFSPFIFVDNRDIWKHIKKKIYQKNLSLKALNYIYLELEVLNIIYELIQKTVNLFSMYNVFHGLQSIVKLMIPWWKYTFQRVSVLSIGCLPIFIFGLLPERLRWGSCWWWSTINIWPKARVSYASFVMVDLISAKHIAQVHYLIWNFYCLCYCVKLWLLKC